MFDKLRSARLDEWVNPSLPIGLLRVGAAALILTHGVPKLLRILDGNMSFGDPIGIGPEASLILVVCAEFVCALLLLAGLWTRAALIPLMINMSVVVFIAHAADPFGRKELGLFFLITFIVLFLTGPGKYSLDHLFAKKSSNR